MEPEEILIWYARAMHSAQTFELGLQGLLGLYRTYEACGPDAPPFTDEEFLTLLAGRLRDHKSASPVLEALFKIVKKHHSQPLFADCLLVRWKKMIFVRNYLAHRYLIEHALLIREDAEARPRLRAQLIQCSDLFKTTMPVIEEWGAVVSRALNVTETQRAEIEKQENQNRFEGWKNTDTLENLLREIDQIDLTIG